MLSSSQSAAAASPPPSQQLPITYRNGVSISQGSDTL